MTKRCVSVEDFLHKVAWEGGVLEAFFGYGLTPEHLPILEDEAEIEKWRELYNAVEELAQLNGRVQESVNVIESIMDDLGVE